MKSENQVIGRCDQPINIEKPFQSLHLGERNISYFLWFSVFILSVLSKVMMIVIIEFMFWAINLRF